jgi:hypothetical protein
LFPNDEDSKNEIIKKEGSTKPLTEEENKKKTEKTECTEECLTKNTELKQKEQEKEKEKEQASENNITPIEEGNNINNTDLTLQMIDLNINDENMSDILEGKDKEMLKKKRGRKPKGSSTGDHNKYSDDNLRRKCKHLVLKYIFDFINKKVCEIYKKVDKGIISKKLLTIKQDQISNATIDFNQKFLNKKIGDIFSEDISSRYTNYLVEHNKNLIKSLINEKDDDIRGYFTGLFNLKFIECLKHFRGTENYYYLNGLTTFDEIKFENDKEYLEVLTKYIFNYEKIIGNKKARTTYD